MPLGPWPHYTEEETKWHGEAESCPRLSGGWGDVCIRTWALWPGSPCFHCPSGTEGLEGRTLAVEARAGWTRPGLVSGHVARSQVSGEREYVGDRVGSSLELTLWPQGCFLEAQGYPRPFRLPSLVMPQPCPWEGPLSLRDSCDGGPAWREVNSPLSVDSRQLRTQTFAGSPTLRGATSDRRCKCQAPAPCSSKAPLHQAPHSGSLADTWREVSKPSLVPSSTLGLTLSCPGGHHSSLWPFALPVCTLPRGGP